MAADSLKSCKDLTLAELIETDFVTCDNCGAVFTAPLLLPCLHTFCRNCILQTIAQDNLDRLTGEEPKTPSTKHQEEQLDADNNQSQAKIDDDHAHHAAVNGHGNNAESVNTHSKDCYYTFNCPTCKSQITIEAGCSLDSKCSITDQQDHSIDKAKTQSVEEQDSSVEKDDGHPSAPSIQSLSIPATEYRRLQNAIHRGLPYNHFVGSMARLYRYKHEVDRECAYCKTEDVVVKATCLCLQCDDDVCEDCACAHRKTRLTRGHSVVSYTAVQEGLFDHDIRKAKGIACDNHPEADVTHFCNDCFKMVCKHCRSKQHPRHNTHPLMEAASRLTQDILNVQEGLSRRIPDLSQYMDFLSGQLESLQQRHDTARLQINAQVDLIHRMVDDWRVEIVSDLDTAVTRERQAIQEKMDSFSVSKDSTEKSATFLFHLYNLGKADEKMGSYPSIMRRYQQLIRAKPKAMTSRLGISFTPGPTTAQNIQILIGQLGLKQETFDDGDTPKSRLPISSLMPATLEHPELINSWHICPSPPSYTKEGINHQSLQGPSSCYISGITVKGTLLAAVDRNNAKVIIVDHSNQKILKEFTGSGAHKLQKPFDLVFLPNGALAVTDPEASAVRVFDWTGKYLFTFEGNSTTNDLHACQGNGQRQDGDRDKSAAVRHPRGITVTKKGEVVVLDGHLRHCTVHDSNTGKILWTIYPHKADTRKSNAFKNSGANTDLENGPKSNAEQKLGEPETNLLDVILVDPFYICTSQDNNLVITDAASPNVKILGWPSGELLQESLDYGIRQEECLHPAGVCVDHKSGYILLVDTNNNRIHLGLPDGHFSAILIPSTQSKPTDATTSATSHDHKGADGIKNDSQMNLGQLSHPTCLCLNQDGHIMVAQVGGKINVYKYVT